MNSLEELLLLEMSRRNTDLVADTIFQRPELFGELMNIYLHGNDPANRRAAWVADTVSEKQPELISPYLDQIAHALPAFSHDGLKRHALRMLARSPLPKEEFLGSVINICFEWLTSALVPAAPKVYCMELLYRISENEPDLKKELADSIEWRMHEETPGVRHRGTIILKKLYQEMNQTH